jgi:hypothetical protein
MPGWPLPITVGHPTYTCWSTDTIIWPLVKLTRDIRSVWIAAAARLTNFLILDCYHRPRLDQCQRFGTKPIFWSHRCDSTPTPRPDGGGRIVRKFFSEPILTGLARAWSRQPHSSSNRIVSSPPRPRWHYTQISALNTLLHYWSLRTYVFWKGPHSSSGWGLPPFRGSLLTWHPRSKLCRASHKLNTN